MGGIISNAKNGVKDYVVGQMKMVGLVSNGEKGENFSAMMERMEGERKTLKNDMARRTQKLVSIITGQKFLSGRFQKNRSFADHFDLSKEGRIGEGATSQVYKCTSKVGPRLGEHFALKKIDKVQAARMAGIGGIRVNTHGMQTIKDMLWLEVDFLMNLSHVNIIKTVDAFESRNSVYVVMEICVGGDLWSYMPGRELTNVVNNRTRQIVIQQLCSAITCLHKHGVVHRDLKPSNVLLTHTPRTYKDVEVKVVDLGLSCLMFKDDAEYIYADGEETDGPEGRKLGRMVQATGRVGTILFMPPEMVDDITPYSYPADMFCLGGLVYILLSGEIPFSKEERLLFHVKEACEIDLDNFAFDSVSDAAKDLITKLVLFDSSKRITLDEVNAHPYITVDETHDEDGNELPENPVPQDPDARDDDGDDDDDDDGEDFEGEEGEEGEGGDPEAKNPESMVSPTGEAKKTEAKNPEAKDPEATETDAKLICSPAEPTEEKKALAAAEPTDSATKESKK